MLRKEKVEARKQRKKRVKDKVWGTSERPRLCVFKSSRHIYAQVIDDSRGCTLAAASTLSPEIREIKKTQGKVGIARQVGTLIAAKVLTAQIKKVAFDRNGFIYHGRIKAIAEAAREKGLDF